MSASRNLPEPTIYITGHGKTSDESKYLPSRSLRWAPLDHGNMVTGIGYVNKLPADLNGDADLDYDRERNNAYAGLVSAGSAALRYIDLAPGYTCMTHRTKSLEYGIVLQGVAECILGSGEVREVKAGDTVVQRYTMHAWRNTSQTEWARILFVFMDCEPLEVGGKTLKEDLGWGASFVPASRNS